MKTDAFAVDSLHNCATPGLDLAFGVRATHTQPLNVHIEKVNNGFVIRAWSPATAGGKVYIAKSITEMLEIMEECFPQ